MQRVRLTLGFLRALRLAGWRDLRHKGFWLTMWGGIILAWGLLKLVLRGESAMVSRRIHDQRMNEGCLKCPVFCHELQTCGDAREMDVKEPLGCYCWMVWKTWLKDARCWLHEPEQGDGRLGGWPKESPQ